MIVPMKKLSVIVRRSDSDACLQRLRSLGVMHIEHVRAPRGERVALLEEKRSLVMAADRVLAAVVPPAGGGLRPVEDPRLWEQRAQHIIDLHDRIDHLSEYARSLQRQVVEWECWGDFDPRSVQALSERGIFVRFYRISAREFKKFPREGVVKVCSRRKGMVLCAVVSRKERSEIPYQALELPALRVSAMSARRQEAEEVLRGLRKELQGFLPYRAVLSGIRRKLEEDLEYAQALSGMGQAEQLSYLTGFIPSDVAKSVTGAVRQQRWALSIQDPAPDDAVPTLIRNPRWIAIIRPVFRMLEIVPGYRELDISLWFLLFFSVFFGMLIGDAGYGVLFLLLTFWAQRRWGAAVANKSPFVLSYCLSACAVLWGIFTGTFFGQAWLPAGFTPLFPALRDSANLQRLCFLIGALHLSIAHLWKTLIKLPSLAALAELGWVSILWGAYFLARFLILADPLPLYSRWLFICGGAAVVFFTSPQRNIFKAVGSGIGNLLMNAVNNFTDIVSYIRLFAVGLAAVAVADAFNGMAADVGFGSFASSLAAASILLLGHLLNLALGPMSILVHGVRLNVLEFSTHLEMKWSGFAYRPLKQDGPLTEKEFSHGK